MKVIHTPEQRDLAVQTYTQLGSFAKTIRVLGYPSRHLLHGWVRGSIPGVRLRGRPAEVGDRAVPGHWEGDLVVGPKNSGIVTLVERQARYALVGRLPGNGESLTEIDVIQTLVAGLPESLRRTVAWDKGKKIARYAQCTVTTGCPVVSVIRTRPDSRVRTRTRTG